MLWYYQRRGGGAPPPAHKECVGKTPQGQKGARGGGAAPVVVRASAVEHPSWAEVPHRAACMAKGSGPSPSPQASVGSGFSSLPVKGSMVLAGEAACLRVEVRPTTWRRC